MATLKGLIRVGMELLYQGDSDLGRLQDKISFPADIVVGSGVLARQADLMFSDQRTITGSGTDSLDLSGVLTDVFGTVLAFNEIVAISIRAAAANGDVIRIGGAASNAFVGPWPTGDKHDVAPGEAFMATKINTAVGWPVAAGTADIFDLENVDASAVTYDIIILGRSA